MQRALDNSEDTLHTSVRIPVSHAHLEGELELPAHARGLVVFAHGSGSSQHSPRNQFVARVLRHAGLGTLLLDLFTPAEEQEDDATAALRFDIGFLAQRLVEVIRWLEQETRKAPLHLGLFGASTGGAAALVAAASVGQRIGAIVSRGGRPDLADEALPLVQSPTLLIVGGEDDIVLRLNEEAYARLHCEKELRIVPGATHLFEEPGTLEQVAEWTAGWFCRHLGGQPCN